MHSLKQLHLIIILSLVSLPIYSADLYYGFRFGLTQFDTGISNTTGTSRLEETDFGFKLLAGAPLGNNSAIEAFYTDYGEATLGGHAGDSFTINDSSFNFINNDSELSSGVTAFGINGVYNLSIGKTQTLIGKLGLMRWKNDFKIQSPVDAISSSEDDYDAYWSLGFEQKLGKTLALVFEYEALSTDNIDLNSIGMTIAVKF